jgi:hypothetical protein
MRQLITSILIIINFISAISNDFIADSINFTIIDDTTQVICENNDTVFLDLDKNGLFDIKIWKYSYIDSCYSSYYQTNKSRSIYMSSRSGFEALSNIIAGAFLIPAKIQYGNSIDTSYFFHGPFRIYINAMMGHHCGVVELGWERSDIGFIAIRKNDEISKTYYLVKLRISNDANCFQVIHPNDDRLISNIIEHKKTVNICLKNDMLCISNYSLKSEKLVSIYNVQGNLVFEKEINNMVEEIDFSGYQNGIFLINVYDKENGSSETFKIIK